MNEEIAPRPPETTPSITDSLLPPPPPPANFETDAGVVDPSGLAPEEGASSAVAVLAQPHEPFELGNDWSFGHTKGPGAPIHLSRSRKPFALALVVVLVAAAGAFFFLNRSKSGGGTALALTLTKGQTYRYHVDMTFNGSVKVAGQSAPVTTQFGETFVWEVQSVDATGVATVKMTVEDLTSLVNGQNQPGGRPMTIMIKVAKDGRILTAGNLALTGSASSGQAFPGTDQFLPLLPDHPVKPGDSWDKTFDQDFPFGNGKIHYVAHNTYLRNELVGGVNAAVVGGTVKVPLDLTIDPNEIGKALGVAADPATPEGAKIVFKGTMDLTQTAWLDLNKHTLLKGSISGTMDMTMQLQGVPAPAQIPDGTLGFSGTVTLNIQQASASESTPTPGSGQASAADQAAQSSLRNALTAAKVYFLDHSSYKGISPKTLKLIEPGLAYNAATKAVKGEVSIRDVSKSVVLLVLQSDDGNAFCVVDDAGTVTYGKQDAGKASACTGGW